MTNNDSRRKLMYKLLIHCGQFFLIMLGLLALKEGELLLFGIDSSLALLLALLVYITERKISLNLGINLTLIIFFIFIFYLFISSSARQQSFIWYYSFPVVVFFLKGRKAGLTSSSLLLLLTFLTHIFRNYIPFFTPYPEGLVMRISASFLLITLLLYIYEYSRELTSFQLEKSILALQEKAIRDGLTNLYNRRYLEEIWHILKRQDHDSRKDIAFFMIDLDYFKKYNDNYGHQKGDEVLIRISEMLLSLKRRSSDYVFRYGGEEFSILLYGTNSENANDFACKLREEIENLNIPHMKSPAGQVTASIGYCLSPLSNLIEPTVIIKKADEALYSAKKAGRNCYRKYES